MRARLAGATVTFRAAVRSGRAALVVTSYLVSSSRSTTTDSSSDKPAPRHRLAPQATRRDHTDRPQVPTRLAGTAKKRTRVPLELWTQVCNYSYMNTLNTEELRGWLRGRLPSDLFDGDPQLTVDREEILIVGRIAGPDQDEETSDSEHDAAVAGRVKQFREDTRERRIHIARELEHATGRKVAWGVEVDGQQRLFTQASVPVMTRLRQPERQVLDTLVDSGVARSRSEALAWCVRLVGQHTESWLNELREAMQRVQTVRDTGPTGD